MTAHLVDGHLVYIQSGTGAYDVYRDEGAPALGDVRKDGSGWRATSDDPTVDGVWAATRWEAATALWGLSL